MTFLNRATLMIFILLFSSLYFLSATKVTEIRQDLPSDTMASELLMLPPIIIEAIFGEFKELVSDYQQLKASVFMGGAYETKAKDWETLLAIFQHSNQLDPYFFQTPYYTQALLVWRKSLSAEAIKILERSAKHRTWDWETAFFLGFDYYYYLHENEIGYQQLMKAATIPDAQPIVRNLAGRIAQKSGATEAAMIFYKSLMDRSQDPKVKENLTSKIKAYSGIFLLEKAIKSFSQEQEQLPKNLNMLVKYGYIKRIPTNPYSTRYYYNPQTGKVSFDNN